MIPPILPHNPNGIVIGRDVSIGANCILYQQISIAHGAGITIGDNVIMYPGSRVLRNIGNNVKLGANSILCEDIPDNATVVLQKPRVIVK